MILYRSRRFWLAAFVLLLAGIGPAVAQPKARVAQAPTPVPLGSPQAAPAAIPSPVGSLPPASQPSTFPYPAYGSPAPGVDRGVPVAGIPQTVSLDQAVAIGFAKSPLLAQARAIVEIDRAPVDLAKTAVLPNIAGTATTGRGYRELGGTSITSTNTGTGTGTGSGTSTSTSATSTSGGSTNTSLGVTLRQLIFDGGKVAAQLRAAKATENSAIALYKRQLQTVAYNIALAYYQALAAQRNTQVANESVKINQVNANLVAAQIRAGTAARSDLLTAQLPVAQARVLLVRDQGTELSAQAAFVNAMGLEANTYVLPQDDGDVLSGASGTPKVSLLTYDQAVARAYMLRPDFYSQQLIVQSAEASLRAAKLGLFPNINGNASYGTASTDSQGGTFRNSGSIGVTLTLPIFDQGITHAQTVQAQGQLDQAIASLELSRQALQLNVKQALVNLVSARATFVQTQAELANARQVQAATSAQYAAGVTTLPLLLNSEVGLTQALADQVNAVYSLRQAEAALMYAEGANVPA